MNFNPDICLVDINGLGYASMYVPALSRLQIDGFQTGAIHGALASLFMNMERQPNAIPIVLWDQRAKWRVDLLPQYKGNRTDKPEKVEIRRVYKLQVPVIQLMLCALGIPQISCSDAEADDLAGVICREIDSAWHIELTTKDTDWYQSIGENVVWYSPLTKKLVDLAILSDPKNGLSDGHFLSPKEYIQAKALAGDTSDCIPGIEKVGSATAVKIMRAHGKTIMDYWNAVDEGRHVPKGVVENRVAEAQSREIYERNLRLMDWSQSPPLKYDTLAITAGKPDWNLATEIADEYGLKKTISKAKDVMKKWENGSWGDGLWAVDSALNHHISQPVLKQQ